MSHDNHMRDTDTPGPTLTELLDQHNADVYQPKHLKQYDYSSSHCCFSGCTPMGCPGGCCANGFGHESHCSMSPGNQLAEAYHEIYTANGGPKHLLSETVNS